MFLARLRLDGWELQRTGCGWGGQDAFAGGKFPLTLGVGGRMILRLLFAERPEGFPSGQRDQTVNLMAQPS